MFMSHGKTFITVLTLLGMVASLHWPAMVQAGGGGTCCGGPPPQFVDVVIVIKPGDDRPSINPHSHGKIPVAVLGTRTFDVTTINPDTVDFHPNRPFIGQGAAPVAWALDDVNGDGLLDLVFHFYTQDTGIECGDTSAVLQGETFSGDANILGIDTFRTVGCNSK
jgi:hypothetical protein